MKKLWTRIQQWFYSEWLLTVYFPGSISGQRIRKEFRLSKVTKLTNKHIKGITVDGRDWEIRNSQPFDYRLERIH